MSFELTGLPISWEVRRLNECVDEGAVTYGIVQPGAEDPDGVPIVRVNNFNSGSIVLRDLLKVSKEVESKYGRTRLRGGEVLLTLVGSVGQVAIAPESLKGCNVARAVGMMRPKPEVGSRWLSLCLRSPESQRILGLAANTTVQTTINLKDVKALPIPLPPTRERHSIEETICAFDDKIAILQQTNATLEAIAQALFKSWFVDFDPVRAKAEGRDPEGVPPEVADLFPSEFQDSELGVIPKGWSIGTLAQAALLLKQSRKPQDEPETEFAHYSLPAFDNGQCPVCEAGSAIKSNKFAVPVDAVLISKLNPHIPRIWLPTVSDPQVSVCSTEFLVMKPKAVFSREWIYLLACSEQFKSWLLQLVTGTSNSHQRVKPDNLTDIQIVHPPALIMNAFTAITSPMLGRVMKNRVEIQTLASTRDTLLPRLMSGKLRVGEPQMEVR